MQVEETPLKDCYLIKPRIFEDKRGIFLETYHRERFAELVRIDTEFVQDNQSVSSHGVLRGIHYQKGDFAQTKLVRVIFGKVLDVVVDLRPDSPTYKQTYSTILDDENLHQLYVPKGFGHGFLTLSEKSVFAYKCDDYYKPGSEGGIIFNDPDLNIDWNFPEEKMILSEKDSVLPTLKATFG
ncbi:dTDP-4-dehydrorhamnose 3,5-epimerase [Christiangramia sabulilitoris]|uniref:dTDP-4-dehydrorhamnose 3,5-epimerase n=1 Tax=Christiangramia sabulilitoris TaxID=2583991 RepID=A0A550I8R5_9FLAO|nr:dTDP-4-dehydrorhamnose 3,5-epimerase [Christiangramia sabulilitoris]TRO67364.1 dTDP-4-dehydrorhamnose 3,5-epimerase [Christiangramia sabulilitoris]